MGEAEEARPRKGLGSAAAAGGAIALSQVKGVGAFLLKGAGSKAFVTAATMLASFAVYATTWTWRFALGFIVLLFLHECGHAIAMQQKGLRASWPVFVPFFGAFIRMHDAPADEDEEAYVAYAGPVAGVAAAMAFAAYGLAARSPFAFAMARTGLFLNLFNLVPLGGLDGGRIARAFSRRAWLVGAIAFCTLFFVAPSPQLAIIGAVSLLHSVRRTPPAELPPELARAWTGRYFGLIGYAALALAALDRLPHAAR
jgi:Zn-dependent protease